MLQITIPDTEYFDEATNMFTTIKGRTIFLEHSLLSLAKWESKWHKPFLSRDPKTFEESIDYIRCMTIDKNVDPLIYYSITPEVQTQINNYVEDKMTATWFSDREMRRPNREIVTAEIIYYWMVTLNIPFECEKWHLNRLLTLIQVCDVKNAAEQKMSKKEILAKNRALNNARRKRTGSRG